MQCYTKEVSSCTSQYGFCMVVVAKRIAAPTAEVGSHA